MFQDWEEKTFKTSSDTRPWEHQKKNDCHRATVFGGVTLRLQKRTVGEAQQTFHGSGAFVSSRNKEKRQKKKQPRCEKGGHFGLFFW